MEKQFEHLGYFKEYYIGCKFIGSIPCEKDREYVGYLGRKIETLTTDIILRKKKFKAGQEVTTIIYPMCGRIIK